MKFIWTLLCSVVLVLSQFASLATPSPQIAVPCACSSCTQISCCACGAPSVPLAPTAPQTESRIQLAPVILLAVPVAPVTPFVGDSYFSVSLRSFSAVPIYDRFCAYLI